jgi:2-dehydropantoate 2-reductase
VEIGVMGAGAIGCYVGGRLVASGADVTFVGRERLGRELRDRGMLLTALDGESARVAPERIRFETDPAALARCDVVLVCVKSGATIETARALAPILAEGAIVVSFQNGVRNPDDLRANLPQRVLAGIVGFNVLWKDGAEFRRATSGPLVIEAATEDGGELAAALSTAGFDVERVRDVRALQWSKLVINLNNAVSALSDMPTKELVLSPGYRRVLGALISEALDVLRAAKIRPARFGAIPVALFPYMLRLPTAILRPLSRLQLAIDPEARSSMWEDLTRGRLTEVDWLNGEIVRLAESAGASAPKNRRVVELVHAAERAGAGSPKLDAEALFKAITA